MKRTINVEAAKTHNYQKYTVGFTEEVEFKDEEDFNEYIKKAQEHCRELVMEQIKQDLMEAQK